MKADTSGDNSTNLSHGLLCGLNESNHIKNLEPSAVYVRVCACTCIFRVFFGILAAMMKQNGSQPISQGVISAYSWGVSCIRRGCRERAEDPRWSQLTS